MQGAGSSARTNRQLHQLLLVFRLLLFESNGVIVHLSFHHLFGLKRLCFATL
jgi:hypothetical protein